MEKLILKNKNKVRLEQIKYKFNKLLSFLNKIYIINLKERDDRLKQVMKQIKDYNIKNYKIFEGLKPRFKEIDPKIYKNYSLHLCSNKEKYIVGATGCKLSHRKIIGESIDNNYDFILILEDDFEFSDNFLSKLNNFLEKIKSLEWDMLYLGGNFKGKPINDYCIKTNQKNIYKCKNVACTHSYILSKKLFKKVYTELEKYPGEIDEYYVNCIQPFYKTYIYDPILIKQSKSYSNIIQKNTNYFNL